MALEESHKDSVPAHTHGELNDAEFRDGKVLSSLVTRDTRERVK
jgi:hypothetical protein